MRKQKFYLYLNDAETSVVVHSLVHFKNTLIRQGRYTDCIDDLILRIMDAPVRKIKTE